VKQASRLPERAGYDEKLTMAESHKHDHHHPHGHDHVHGGRASAPEPRPSWLLHSAMQRLLGIALIGMALVAAMLWATSTQA
jgi:hypothetical protein